MLLILFTVLKVLLSLLFNTLKKLKCVIYGIKNSTLCGKKVSQVIDWDLEMKFKKLNDTVNNINNKLNDTVDTVNNIKLFLYFSSPEFRNPRITEEL